MSYNAGDLLGGQYSGQNSDQDLWSRWICIALNYQKACILHSRPRRKEAAIKNDWKSHLQRKGPQHDLMLRLASKCQMMRVASWVEFLRSKVRPGFVKSRWICTALKYQKGAVLHSRLRRKEVIIKNDWKWHRQRNGAQRDLILRLASKCQIMRVISWIGILRSKL